ncbi:MAG: hypothetical protein ACJA08_001354 [Cyclobacteriaceae bacterium]|jgi:hypothetical protein
MKKLFVLAFAAILSGLFTSCGEDTVTEVPVETCSGNACLEVSVTSNISSDATWYADSVYLISGRIAVISGVTLTIDAGTIIKGQAGTGANASALVIARGAKLMAEGTATDPIIFTSAADNIQPGEKVSPNLDPSISGLWGGLIVLGKAPVSLKNDATEGAIEGIPTSDVNGLYGGTAADDDSGSIKYVSIRHGGSNIGEGNEINGISLGGVGSATMIEYVEVVANADDGIEFFGGTVSLSKVLIWNSNDDGLDTDQDWQGTCSDFVIMTPQGGSAFELDGPEGTEKVNGTSGFHTFNNGVVYAGANIVNLVDWDSNTNAAITNVYFYGLDTDWIVDGDDPIASYSGDASGASSGWETTIPAASTKTKAEIFGDADGITTEVTARTVGPAKSVFEGWTWAGISGELTEIGL